jgi:hypothetical protein
VAKKTCIKAAGKLTESMKAGYERIREIATHARCNTARSVNTEMLLAYWNLPSEI